MNKPWPFDVLWCEHVQFRLILQRFCIVWSPHRILSAANGPVAPPAVPRHRRAVPANMSSCKSSGMVWRCLAGVVRSGTDLSFHNMRIECKSDSTPLYVLLYAVSSIDKQSLTFTWNEPAGTLFCSFYDKNEDSPILRQWTFLSSVMILMFLQVCSVASIIYALSVGP